MICMSEGHMMENRTGNLFEETYTWILYRLYVQINLYTWINKMYVLINITHTQINMQGLIKTTQINKTYIWIKNVNTD